MKLKLLQSDDQKFVDLDKNRNNSSGECLFPKICIKRIKWPNFRPRGENVVEVISNWKQLLVLKQRHLIKKFSSIQHTTSQTCLSAAAFRLLMKKLIAKLSSEVISLHLFLFWVYQIEIFIFIDYLGCFYSNKSINWLTQAQQKKYSFELFKFYNLSRIKIYERRRNDERCSKRNNLHFKSTLLSNFWWN